MPDTVLISEGLKFMLCRNRVTSPSAVIAPVAASAPVSMAAELFIAVMTALFMSSLLISPVDTMTGRKKIARKAVRPGRRRLSTTATKREKISTTGMVVSRDRTLFCSTDV